MLRQLWQKFIPIFAVFSLRSAFPWIMLIVGLIAAIFGFSSLIDGCPNWQEICKWISNILIVSVIIGFISSYFQYKGIYQKNLFDVIYGKEFLKKRNDIDSIWSNVTEVLFESKFPEISNEIFDVINRHYIKKKEYYVSNQTIVLTVKWHDKVQGLVEIIEETEFNVIPKNKSKFQFVNLFTSEVVLKEGKAFECCHYELMSYSINDKDVSPRQDPKTLKNVKHFFLEVDLENCESYKVKRTIKKVQNLNFDCTVGFKARSFINKLRLQIFNEIHDDIKICFMPRGVLEEYKVKERKDFFECEYDGLLLPKQGYILTLLNTYKCYGT
ncbi:hypothetical protein BN938_1187 [Mucinivorans hirudinis]|uniref:Uncharacterized protein n=1 Tax=Mucinivorans hirudinis TaxID=1433126 RepID=A0A060R7L3_9BACT|nr:hypothetical protein BN938_1187 [Mucinivorans hirudinis]